MFAGTHFFVSFLQNEVERGSSLRLQLSIASRAPTTVWIRLPNESQPRQYRLGAGEYRWIALPPELEVRTLERPVAAAVEVRSDAPIVVYAFNSQNTTTDAYTAIPVTNWGTDYIIASLPNDAYTPRPGDTTINRLRDLTLRRSEWMVIAAYDSTTVTFIPRTRTAMGKAAGVAHTVVLNRGECYLVQADSTPKGLGDMTGTRIQSSKPIGVLSGHVRVSLPFNLPAETDTKDHLVEMLPPIPALGQRYISTPFAVGTGDWFRAIAAFPQTQLTLTRATGSSVQTVLQNAGDVADFPAEAAPILWEANKPFLLVQLMYSAVIGGPQALVDPYRSFDPCMVVVPPLEQFVQQAHFFVPDTTLLGFNQFKRHWVNLVVSEDAIATARLNGTLLTSIAPTLPNQQLPWTLSGTRYHWLQLPVAPGTVYELRTQRGAFAGILYGTGYVDSYALVLGSGLLPPGQSDATPPTVSPRTSPCGGLTLLCSDTEAGIAWAQPIPDSTWNYRWTYTQSTPHEALLQAQPDDPSRDGQLLVEVRDNAGNRQWYRQRYWAPRLQWNPLTIQLLGVPVSGVSCQDLQLINSGYDTVTIRRITANDRRLTITATLPIVLPPQGSTTVSVCLRPNGDSRPLRDTVTMETSCSVVFSVPAEGTVDSLGLVASSCSFGTLLVGDEGRCDVYWVNTGNRPLLVTGVNAIRGESAFSLDTAGLFPYNLATGDTVRVPVRFRPPYRGIFREELLLITSPAIAVTARVDGRGAAPEVGDVTVDWGQRRLGRRYDSVVVLANRGDAPTTLSLIADEDSITALGHSIPRTVMLGAGDSVRIPVWFAPQQRRLYERRLVLESSWDLHPPITLTLRGEGIAPELRGKEVAFDTVLLGSSRDTVALVLETGGNEPTAIDSLWLEGADAAAFAVLPPYNLPQLLTPGDSLRLWIRFTPQRSGKHTAQIVLRHNGSPPYQTDTLHIPLVGYGKALPPIDTFAARWTLQVAAPETVIACRTFQLQLCLQNQGNTQLVCDSVELIGAALQNIFPTLPQNLSPADSLCLRLAVAGLPTGQTRLRLRLSLRSEYIFQDTVRTRSFTEEVLYTVLALPQRWSIEQIDTLTAEPGDRLILRLSGTMPSADAATAAGRLCLRAPTNVWSFELTAAEFTVRTSNQLLHGTITAAQEEPEGFCIQVAPLPSLAQPAQWELSLPVTAFADNGQRYLVHVATLPDSAMCFVGDTATGVFFLVGVCAQQFRSIRLQEAPETALVRLFPQPASDELILAFRSSAPTQAHLRLLTLEGRSAAEWQVELPKGEVLRKFGIAALPSGVYLLQLLHGSGSMQRIVVIQR